MKINRKKLELVKARTCMGQKEIVAAGFPAGTLTNAMTGKNIKPKQPEDLPKFLVWTFWKSSKQKNNNNMPWSAVLERMKGT